MNGAWLCRIGLHSWQTIRDTRVHHYDVCRRCRRRRIVRVMRHGYQPRDLDWLATGEWRRMYPPRPTLPVGATKEGGNR